jgi:hypothetical protein
VLAAERLYETQHEIVIDLDIKDWDERIPELRTGLLCDCAIHQKICVACWALVRLAHEVFSSLLQHAWQLGSPLWVFSGGKGAHCYYGSPRARQLTRAQRESLRKEFGLWQDPKDPKERESIADAWTAHSSALAQRVQQRFEDLFADIFDSSRGRAWLATQLPTLFHGARFLECCPITGTWHAFVSYCSASVNAATCSKCVMRVVVSFALPPVDMSHFEGGPMRTTKLPFSIHTTTYQIALPLDETAFHAFDPRADAVAIGQAGERRAQLEAARATLDAWLTANEYPPG